jgi:hypothetical protein
MQINEIFLSILEKPNIPRYYRELQSFYKNIKMFDEASAIGYLLENKFEKKNENTSEHTDIDERQSGNN